MYTHQSKFRQIRYNFNGKRILIVLVVVIVLCLPFIVYYMWLRKKRDQFKNKRALFESLIYEYTLEKKKIGFEKIPVYIDSFHMTNELWNPSDLGLDENRRVWTSDAETFGKVINTVHGLMSWTVAPNSPLYKDAKIWEIILHTIRVVAIKVPTEPSRTTFLWGGNWYQFSITYPLFLVSATYMYKRLFKRNDEMMTRHLSTYIAKYFIDPKLPNGMESMGWFRDGPNAVMMAVPYTGGHLFMKDWSPNTTSMRYVKKYVSLELVTSGNGFYADDTFVFHSRREADGTMVGLRALGYLTSSYADFVLMSRFFGIPNVIQAIHSILSKTEHPTIPLHFGPWFNRGNNQHSTLSRFGKLGSFVFDHARSVVFKTPNSTIGFNGQHPELCYYESDNSNYHWGQYWAFSRRFMYENTDQYIYRELVPYYPGVWSYGRVAVDMKSENSTTNTHAPEKADCIIVHEPNQAIGMYNKYNINMKGVRFDVTELTMVTDVAVHCFYEITPDASLIGDNAITLAVQVGKLDITNPQLYGTGNEKGRRFKEAASFVYPGQRGQVYTVKLQNPASSDEKNKLDAMYIEPHVKGTKATCGFSTVHTESNSNELLQEPTIHRIETQDFILISPKDHPESLILWNKTTKTAAISCNMGLKYNTSLRVKKSIPDTVFESGYTSVGGVILDKNICFQINNGNKFQAMFENVSLRQ